MLKIVLFAWQFVRFHNDYPVTPARSWEYHRMVDDLVVVRDLARVVDGLVGVVHFMLANGLKRVDLGEPNGWRALRVWGWGWRG